MDEQVLAAFRGDEAEALGVVEPLDGTGLTIGHDVLLLGTVFEVYTVRVGGSATVSARGNAKRWRGSADLPHRNHDVPCSRLLTVREPNSDARRVGTDGVGTYRTRRSTHNTKHI